MLVFDNNLCKKYVLGRGFKNGKKIFRDFRF